MQIDMWEKQSISSIQIFKWLFICRPRHKDITDIHNTSMNVVLNYEYQTQ